jgi:hypothetical protein
MEIRAIGSQPSQTQAITVPPGANSIVAFNSSVIALDANGNIYEGHAFISANLNKSFSDILAGDAGGLLAISNSQFPKIPVQEGEKMLVTFEASGSAVIYFDSAE